MNLYKRVLIALNLLEVQRGSRLPLLYTHEEDCDLGGMSAEGRLVFRFVAIDDSVDHLDRLF